jgi:hypothetical protein
VVKKVWRTAAVLLIVLVLLAGCTLVGETESPDTVRSDLLARLDKAQRSQQAALTLWDRLILGETVSCQEFISVPEPIGLSEQDLAAHPNAGAIQVTLNTAIQSLRNSADLWNIECDAERAYVPLSMAKAGRSTALEAAAPLEEAAALLAAW